MDDLRYIIANPDIIGYELRYLKRKYKQKAAAAIAWRLPKSVAYWAAIRVGANATTGKYATQVVPELTFMDAIRRWDYDA